jgi:hypothetical protein
VPLYIGLIATHGTVKWVLVALGLALVAAVALAGRVFSRRGV